MRLQSIPRHTRLKEGVKGRHSRQSGLLKNENGDGLTTSSDPWPTPTGNLSEFVFLFGCFGVSDPLSM